MAFYILSQVIHDDAAAIFELAVAAAPSRISICQAGQAGKSGGDRVCRSDSDPSSTAASLCGAVRGSSSAGAIALTEEYNDDKGVDDSAVPAYELAMIMRQTRLYLIWQ